MTKQFLAISMMGVALASVPSRAQAQPWNSPAAAYANDDYRAPYADAQRSAYEKGYRSGLKRGAQAVRDRRPLEIERERDYRRADEGYNRSFGDRNRYRDAFRGGFSAGYRDGYWQRGARLPFPTAGRDYGRGPSTPLGTGYGGTANFGARQNGLGDGYEKGLDDVKDRKYADVSRHKWFRNGDHDYDDRSGSKESYRVEYRRGFKEGYTRAYREARRY